MSIKEKQGHVNPDLPQAIKCSRANKKKIFFFDRTCQDNSKLHDNSSVEHVSRTRAFVLLTTLQLTTSRWN